LHPRDAMAAFGVQLAHLADPQRWPQHVAHQGVGGARLYFREQAFYLFQHDDGSWQPVAGEIDIAQAQPDNQDLPSILDWDVLQHFRVVVNWPARQITLG
jgi:hypothetical protein